MRLNSISGKKKHSHIFILSFWMNLNKYIKIVVLYERSKFVKPNFKFDWKWHFRMATTTIHLFTLALSIFKANRPTNRLNLIMWFWWTLTFDCRFQLFFETQDQCHANWSNWAKRQMASSSNIKRKLFRNH